MKDGPTVMASEELETMGPDVLHAFIARSYAGADLPAVKDLDRDLSYAELRDEVARLATGMSGRCVVEGDRVALLLPNSVDFVVAALACLWVGAIFVPLSVADPEARVRSIVADCAPTIVIVPDATEEVGASSGAGDPPHSFGDVPLVPVASLRSEGSEAALVEPVPETPRAVYAIYTSGTTGTPKGVLIGSSAFRAAVEATSQALGLDQMTRTLCVSPFCFDGSFGTLFPTLFVGGAVVIRPREALLFPRTFFNAVAKEGITYTGFSPSYLRLLLASPQMANLAESSLDVIALGGEASSVADIRALWSVAPKLRVFNRYGPTETTIAVTHIHLVPDLVAEGTVPLGNPHPGVSFYLVDERGAVIDQPDRVGELYVGGSQLMTGYWGAPALTDDVLRTDIVQGETVYRTGDLVYRDVHGHYVYTDRADRVIKRSGVRISLVELSEAMRSLDGVSAAACVIFDDEGELGIVAFVVVERSFSVLELQQAARVRLPETMLPNRIELVDGLPLTNSSKLDERLLLSKAGLRPRPGAAGRPLVAAGQATTSGT
jgi:D-alanine--poly(phosphoribitol) ligase subunit 1